MVDLFNTQANGRPRAADGWLGDVPVAATGTDKRADRRKALRADVQVRPEGGPAYDGRTLDVSVSGLAYVAPLNPVLGTHCFVQFKMFVRNSGIATLGLRALVMASIYSSDAQGFRVGLRFVDPPASAVGMIKSYIDG